ncbi:MAG: hypothetical protein HYY04_01520 [Chloroflexi bacterium]|nr:hypothetical protein [Chloroflexota bacterium]
MQPECMDPFAIKREYGDRLVLGGTIGCQSTMAFGTPDEVRETVRRHIEGLGQGGGFFLSPANSVLPETPCENVLAFFQAADEYGWYSTV